MLYRSLIALRLEHNALTGSQATSGYATAPDGESIVVSRSEGEDTFLIVARFKSAGVVDVGAAALTLGGDLRDDRVEVVLDTEHAEYADAPMAIDVTGGTVRFQRPGAVILRAR